MQNARCQQGGPKRFKGPFLSPDEGQEGSQKQLQHQPTVMCLRNWLNKPLSAQTAGGWDEEKGGDWTKPYRFVKFHFQNTPENDFGFLHQHFASKDCFKSRKEEARSYSLCHYLHLLFPLCFGENCSSKQLQSRKLISAVTPSDPHTPTETCPSPQTTCYFLGRNRLLLQRVNPDP